tara:strand:- start:10945 stop:12183 length:1239 start_codon:yes stop_codon:yes gene_type:complete
MDILISIIILIVIIILTISIIYIIKDYINYKDNVNKSIDISTNNINNNFDKINENIEIETNYINNKVNNFEEDINKLENNDEYIVKDVKTLKDNIANLNDNIKFENKVYIDNTGITSASYLEPNIKLLNRVNSLMGMTIITDSDSTNNKNLSICDNGGRKIENGEIVDANVYNCVHMNINNGNFNIIPDGIKELNIQNKENETIAKFDTKNKSIYLGGSNKNNSPLFIHNDKVYIDNLNIVRKNADGTDISNLDNNILLSMNNTGIKGSSTYNKDYIHENNNNVNVKYNILRSAESNETKIELYIYNNDINENNIISIPIDPYFKINTNVTHHDISGYLINKQQNTPNISFDSNKNNIFITLNSKLNKYQNTDVVKHTQITGDIFDIDTYNKISDKVYENQTYAKIIINNNR